MCVNVDVEAKTYSEGLLLSLNPMKNVAFTNSVDLGVKLVGFYKDVKKTSLSSSQAKT